MRWTGIVGAGWTAMLVVGCAGTTPWATRTPPARDFVARVGACRSGEVRVCINQCKPIVTQEGAPCVVDPCMPSGGVGVCDVRFDCAPDSSRPGFGTCQPATAILCDPNLPREGANRCASGLLCIPLSCPGSPRIRGEGVCRARVSAGSPCDERCGPCEAGTACGPSLSGSGRACRRLCTGEGGECVTGDFCLPLTGSPRFCAPCT